MTNEFSKGSTDPARDMISALGQLLTYAEECQTIIEGEKAMKELDKQLLVHNGDNVVKLLQESIQDLFCRTIQLPFKYRKRRSSLFIGRIDIIEGGKIIHYLTTSGIDSILQNFLNKVTNEGKIEEG